MKNNPIEADNKQNDVVGAVDVEDELGVISRLMAQLREANIFIEQLKHTEELSDKEFEERLSAAIKERGDNLYPEITISYSEYNLYRENLRSNPRLRTPIEPIEGLTEALVVADYDARDVCGMEGANRAYDARREFKKKYGELYGVTLEKAARRYAELTKPQEEG